MAKILSQIIAGILGIWLAAQFVPGVILTVLPDSGFFGLALTAKWQIILLLGFILGLINFFVKPILRAVTLPLRILTLGFFGLLINIATIWALDFLFQELTVPWLWPLLYTTLIVWVLNLFIPRLFSKRRGRYIL